VCAQKVKSQWQFEQLDFAFLFTRVVFLPKIAHTKEKTKMEAKPK
jgi:hypothetical protein